MNFWGFVRCCKMAFDPHSKTHRVLRYIARYYMLSRGGRLPFNWRRPVQYVRPRAHLWDGAVAALALPPPPQVAPLRAAAAERAAAERAAHAAWAVLAYFYEARRAALDAELAVDVAMANASCFLVSKNLTLITCSFSLLPQKISKKSCTCGLESTTGV